MQVSFIVLRFKPRQGTFGDTSRRDKAAILCYAAPSDVCVNNLEDEHQVAVRDLQQVFNAGSDNPCLALQASAQILTLKYCARVLSKLTVRQIKN